MMIIMPGTPKVKALNLTRNNGELVDEVARLYVKDRDTCRVLDPTYGRGGMWSVWMPVNLTINTSDFTQPLGYGPEFDLVLLDGPYTAKGGAATSVEIEDHDDRYGREQRWDEVKTALTVAEVFRLQTLGMKNCADVVKSGGMLWVKSADYVTSGKMAWGNHDVRVQGRKLGLIQVDELYLPSNSPQPKVNLDGTPRRQVHAARGFSMLSVWKKPKK